MILQKGKNANAVVIKEKALSAGLGWDTGKSSEDLDLLALCLNDEGKLESLKNVVDCDNLDIEGIHHTGDNKTGAGEFDDEMLIINLEKVSESIQGILFIVTIEGNDTFKQVSNAEFNLAETTFGKEYVRVNFTNTCADESTVIVGSLSRDGDVWSYISVLEGFKGDFKALCSKYGY